MGVTMNRNELDAYIYQTYKVKGEHPWESYPSHTVYRHNGNKKWFAVIMDLPGAKICLPHQKQVQVVNVKCDSLMIGSMLQEEGIYPGYHMNKSHWITLLLDGTLEEDKLKWLLDISFDLTDKKRKSYEIVV